MFVIFCGGLQLSKCHIVAVSKDLGIWFNIIRERYCDKAIYNLVEKIEAASARLCSKLRQPKVAIMSDTLANRS